MLLFVVVFVFAVVVDFKFVLQSVLFSCVVLNSSLGTGSTNWPRL